MQMKSASSRRPNPQFSIPFLSRNFPQRWLIILVIREVEHVDSGFAHSTALVILGGESLPDQVRLN